jgi:hypothetical protein
LGFELAALSGGVVGHALPISTSRAEL